MYISVQCKEQGGASLYIPEQDGSSSYEATKHERGHQMGGMHALACRVHVSLEPSRREKGLICSDARVVSYVRRALNKSGMHDYPRPFAEFGTPRIHD
jgi:hypothetical protein